MSSAGAVDRLTDLGFAAGWSVVRGMPEWAADRAFRIAADVAYRRRGPAVVQLARNLRRVLGPRATPETLAPTVRDGMRSYARYWRETFRLPAMDLDAVAASVAATTFGGEHIARAQREGRGIVLTVPHAGNWDIAALWVTRNFGPLTTVVERLKPETLYDKFVAYRESLGMEILPLTGGVPPAQILRERLTAGGIIALVGDRDLSANGIPVSFFGEPARFPAGPAMLAALTDSYLCPTDLSFRAGGWVQHIHPPLSLAGVRLAEQVRSGAQQIADTFERGIAAHPADWHMLQPFWPADFPPGHPGAAPVRLPVRAGSAADPGGPAAVRAAR
ncbi:phosphatidylinositol mannoside acyltransferase [Nakamurella sp.]|uniref:phosphatidylinositol mannoside acyltransferase n=1 Tax=Nakamurella sp. TaxID=1869182 RepID=UPI0037842E77